MHLLAGLFISMSLLAPAAQAMVCKADSQKILVRTAEDCELGQEFVRVVSAIQKKFGGPDVTLIVGGTGDNAGYDMGHIINMPSRLVFYGQYDQSFSAPRGALFSAVAHEYGHAIFQERVRAEFPEFAEALLKLKEISNLREQVATGKISQQVYAQANVELRKIPGYLQLHRFFNAYSEFYADVIAAYYFTNKDIMLSTLYYPQISDQEYAFMRLRSFNYKPLESQISTMEESHVKLAFARAFVGQFMWPRNNAEAHLFSQKILSAIMTAVRLDLKVGKAPAVVDMNNQLIKELKDVLAK